MMLWHIMINKDSKHENLCTCNLILSRTSFRCQALHPQYFYTCSALLAFHSHSCLRKTYYFMQVQQLCSNNKNIAVGQFSYDVVSQMSHSIHFYCKSFGITPSEEASVHAYGWIFIEVIFHFLNNILLQLQAIPSTLSLLNMPLLPL